MVKKVLIEGIKPVDQLDELILELYKERLYLEQLQSVPSEEINPYIYTANNFSPLTSDSVNEFLGGKRKYKRAGYKSLKYTRPGRTEKIGIGREVPPSMISPKGTTPTKLAQQLAADFPGNKQFYTSGDELQDTGYIYDVSFFLEILYELLTSGGLAKFKKEHDPKKEIINTKRNISELQKEIKAIEKKFKQPAEIMKRYTKGELTKLHKKVKSQRTNLNQSLEKLNKSIDSSQEAFNKKIQDVKKAITKVKVEIPASAGKKPTKTRVKALEIKSLTFEFDASYLFELLTKDIELKNTNINSLINRIKKEPKLLSFYKKVASNNNNKRIIISYSTYKDVYHVYLKNGEYDKFSIPKM